jgi:hypothetical protein
MQVIFDREGEDDPFVCISVQKVGLTPPSEIQQVLATPTVTVVTFPSRLGEARPYSKKAHTKNCLSPSALYVHEGCYMLIVQLINIGFIPELKTRWSLGGRKHTLGTLKSHRPVP